MRFLPRSHPCRTANGTTEEENITGEPDTLKGVRPVREGEDENVPQGNASAAYFILPVRLPVRTHSQAIGLGDRQARDGSALRESRLLFPRMLSLPFCRSRQSARPETFHVRVLWPSHSSRPQLLFDSA